MVVVVVVVLASIKTGANKAYWCRCDKKITHNAFEYAAEQNIAETSRLYLSLPIYQFVPDIDMWLMAALGPLEGIILKLDFTERELLTKVI